MRRLLAHRDARRYLAGQACSIFGDSCLWLGMGIWVKSLTHSNAQAGLVFFFFTAPALLAPVSGLIVDRVRRRPLLIAANIATALAVLSLLAVHGRGQVWLIDLVMAVYGVGSVLIGIAQAALLTLVVPGELLPDANAALRTVQEGLRLVSPLTGAGLFVAFGGHAIAIFDAATFVFPVASLLLLSLREPRPAPMPGHWRSQMTAGLHHIRRVVPLRHAITAGACATIVFGFAETVTFAIAGNGLHRRAAFVGIMVAVQGIGALLGGLTAARLIRRRGELRLMALALLVAAAGFMLELPPLVSTVLAGEVLVGAALPWLVVALISLAQRLTPPDVQGRVFAAAETLITTPQTISIALGAALIGVTGYRPLLIAMAIGVSAAATYLLTRTRDSEQLKPVPVEPSCVPGHEVGT